ncbi:MAG: NAD(P)/FAD-dependent oxidoreductase [Defluviicoccus sp.]|nr:NAD(P)/FAD-dependent oxidoreductase [Defluviicoccus sp.]MDE0274352.1 NAD(P)/FAD-dependent oxidoreductase [Defluviicoccus sp.]
MSRTRPVVVIGGGIAGLGAAFRLRRRGVPVMVFEAASTTGGRIAGAEMHGFQMDLGANIFLETYGAVREIAEELGVPLRRTRVPINGGVFFNGRLHGFYGGDRLGSRLKTLKTLLSLRLLSPRGVREALRFVRMLRARADDLSFDDPSGALDLDTGESIGEFFEKRIGTECLDRFVGPTLASYTFGRPDEVGVVYAMIAAWNFGLNGTAWPCMPERGPAVFVDALADACREDIRLSTPVRRIEIEDGAVKGVSIDGGFVEADAVICATTATTALRIATGLPAEIRDVLDRVTYSKCCRVFFGLQSSPLPKDWYAACFPAATGATMVGISNSAVLLPGTVPEGKTLLDALVMGKQAEELFALSDAEVGGRMLSEVRRFFPAMTEEPLFTHVHRWGEAVCLAPGGVMTALQEMRQRCLGSVHGLFLAGEYMGVPSTNGALRSGMNAAADCEAFFSRPRD